MSPSSTSSRQHSEKTCCIHRRFCGDDATAVIVRRVLTPYSAQTPPSGRNRGPIKRYAAQRIFGWGTSRIVTHLTDSRNLFVDTSDVPRRTLFTSRCYCEKRRFVDRNSFVRTQFFSRKRTSRCEYKLCWSGRRSL